MDEVAKLSEQCLRTPYRASCVRHEGAAQFRSVT